MRSDLVHVGPSKPCVQMGQQSELAARLSDRPPQGLAIYRFVGILYGRKGAKAFLNPGTHQASISKSGIAALLGQERASAP
jgi:hypothetical protein